MAISQKTKDASDQLVALVIALESAGAIDAKASYALRKAGATAASASYTLGFDTALAQRDQP